MAIAREQLYWICCHDWQTVESSRLHGDSGGKIVEVGVSYAMAESFRRNTCLKGSLCWNESFHSLQHHSDSSQRRGSSAMVKLWSHVPLLVVRSFHCPVSECTKSVEVCFKVSDSSTITTSFLLFSNFHYWPSCCCTTPEMLEQTVPFGRSIQRVTSILTRNISLWTYRY